MPPTHKRQKRVAMGEPPSNSQSLQHELEIMQGEVEAVEVRRSTTD